jgi:hypothetical protein
MNLFTEALMFNVSGNENFFGAFGVWRNLSVCLTLMIINYQLSIINYQLSIINYQL